MTVLNSTRQPARYAVFQDCGVEHDIAVEVVITLYAHPGAIPMTSNGLPACDEIVVKIDVYDAGTGALFFTLGASPTDPNDRNNFVLAKYVRTWLGLGPDGMSVFRFWRYMVEGDATGWSLSMGMPSAAVPDCYSTTPVTDTSFNAVCFRGYLDIMQDLEILEEGEIDDPSEHFTLVMSHYDGCLDHIQTPINPRQITTAGTKHVGRSYHLVAPDNFAFLSGVPTAADLTLPSVTPNDSLRSTVSHTTSGGAPGQKCLAESQNNVSTDTSEPSCDCAVAEPVANTEFNQDFPEAGNWADCGMNEFHWSTFELVDEIPTGFTHEYIGIWNQFARADLGFVRVTNCIGTIEYEDHCAADLEYYPPTGHIVWGNSTLYSSFEAANAPVVDYNQESILTDYLGSPSRLVEASRA